jgi:hypothetical protein
MMEKSELQRKLEVEIRKLELDRYLEGIRVCHDPRDDGYDLKWVEANSDWFREKWEISACRTCAKYKECGLELKKDCERYVKRE